MCRAQMEALDYGVSGEEERDVRSVDAIIVIVGELTGAAEGGKLQEGDPPEERPPCRRGGAEAV